MGRYPIVPSLAPSTFKSYRPNRNIGEEDALELSAFPAEERTMIERLYAALGELDATLRDEHGSPAAAVAFRDRLAALLAPGSRHVGEAVGAALHDIRGGTMTALLFGLDELTESDRPRLARSALRAMIRDQRKIIRHIVRDVDAVGLERDRAAIPHSLAELDGGISSYGRGGRPSDVAVEVHRDADAIVAASCLEFAALERAVFNLLNNAVRHVDGEALDVWLTPLQADARVVVSNRVNAAHADVMTHMLAADPAALYGTFSTTGSGLGLTIVASIVGNAYGLDEPGELVAGGYIGTQIVDGTFLTWLHWPLSR